MKIGRKLGGERRSWRRIEVEKLPELDHLARRAVVERKTAGTWWLGEENEKSRLRIKDERK